MLVDAILDRRSAIREDGVDTYNPRKLYNYVNGWYNEVARAMDEGTEEDVKKVLCKYIIDNDYNPDICNFIKSVNWLE